MKIQESAENYLETILKLKNTLGQVRSIDVANAMGFSKPSVSHAMKLFRENELIDVDAGGYITLTERGLEIANNIYGRHMMLAGFLMAIGVDSGVALEDACKLEHGLSDESYCKLKHFFEHEMKKQ